MRSLFAVVVALGLGAQAWGEKIDFEATARPAAEVVQALGEKLGSQLLVAPDIAREVLVIRATSVESQDLLDRIAQVLGAEWRDLPEGKRRLTILPAKAAEEARAALAKRRAMVDSQLEEVKSRLAQSSDEASAVSTGALARQELILKLDRNALASMMPGDRLVFSTRPTSRQRPLGAVDAQVRKIVAANNQRALELQQKAVDEEAAALTDQQRQAQEWAKMLMLERTPTVIDGTPAKVLVVASRSGVFGGVFGSPITVTMKMYDGQGATLLDEQIGMIMFNPSALADLQAFGASVSNAPAQPVAQTPDDTPIKYSPAVEEIRKALNFQNFGQMYDRELAKDLLERITRPDLYDPVSFDTTEGLFALSAKRDRDLVACVPDEYQPGYLGLTNLPKTLGELELRLRQSQVVDYQIDDQWIRIQPIDKAQARKARVDRGALAKLIAQARAKGVPSLEDLAAYAAVNPPITETPTASTYALLFVPTMVNGSIDGPLNWDALRLYGLMQPTMRDQLARGMRMQLMGLSSAQSEVVRKMLYGADARIEVDLNRPAQEPKSYVDMIRRFVPAPSRDFRQEPTEVAPTGIPPQGFLLMNVTEDPIAGMRNVGGKSTGAYMPLGATELGMVKFFKEDPKFSSMASMMPPMNNLVPGVRRRIEIRIVLAPGVGLRAMLNDERLDMKATPFSMDALPPALAKKVDSAYEIMKESPFPVLPGLGGQQSAQP